MSVSDSGSSVNAHYLRQVMNLAEVMDVAASEDIVDIRGTRLLTKGKRLSRELQDQLALQPLRKPLEATIAIEGGIDTKVIVGEAARLSETSAPLRRILRATSGGASPLKLLADLQLGGAMSMMLTMTERGGPRALEHCVMVSLIAICMAKKLGLDEETQTACALSGLLHDIGELYIEPGYLNPHRRLLPHEWQHIVMHPRIGQVLIENLSRFPDRVGRAVAEHHERHDGSGYPHQLTGAELSIEGQILGVAEMISGVFSKNRPLDRAELALKIIPGEFSHELLSVISGTLRLPPDQEPQAPLEGFDGGDGRDHGEDVAALHRRIDNALRVAESLRASPLLTTAQSRALLAVAAQRTGIIRQAFYSTGLDVYINPNRHFQETRDLEILFEKEVATREIAWRLRDTARDLALHSSLLEGRESSAFQPLVTLLDGRA